MKNKITKLFSIFLIISLLILSNIPALQMRILQLTRTMM